jgi:LEA14-like dessication related protein
MNIKSSGIYAATFFALIFLTRCLNFEPVTVSGVNGVKVQKVENGKATLHIDLMIDNPNRSTIKVKEVDLFVTYGDVKLGRVLNEEGFKLKPESNQSYVIPVVIDTKALKKQSGNLLKSFFKKGITMNIDGHIKAGTFIVTKKIDIHHKANLDVLKSLFD